MNKILKKMLSHPTPEWILLYVIPDLLIALSVIPAYMYYTSNYVKL